MCIIYDPASKLKYKAMYATTFYNLDRLSSYFLYYYRVFGLIFYAYRLIYI